MKSNIYPLLVFILISVGINCHDSELFPSFDINQACEGVFFEARPFPGNRQYFVGCIRSVGALLQCYENELFDENLLRCVNYDGDTTVGIGTTSPPGLDGICEGKDFKFVTHPSDCGKAIFCFQGSPIVRECPQGQIFDINTERCQDGNRNTCELLNLDRICEGLIFDFVPHPSDCGIAIFCFQGTPILRECPAGEIYDARLERCRPGDRETCTISRRAFDPCQRLNALSLDERKFYRCASEQ